MSDLIRRQDAINAVSEGCQEFRGIFARCEKNLNELPSAEPERKKGKWINAYPDIEPNPMFMYGICSVCGCEQAISNKLNFCPDCGSDMRGEQDE